MPVTSRGRFVLCSVRYNSLTDSLLSIHPFAVTTSPGGGWGCWSNPSCLWLKAQVHSCTLDKSKFITITFTGSLDIPICLIRLCYEARVPDENPQIYFFYLSINMQHQHCILNSALVTVGWSYYICQQSPFVVHINLWNCICPGGYF